MTARVIVVHGLHASPSDHWFPWLAHELAARDVSAQIVALPDSDAPHAPVWIETVIDAIGTADGDTVVVGHSLGCITTIHALSQVPNADALAGLVLVSPFAEPLPNLPEVDAFVQGAPDIAFSTAGVPVIVIASDNDEIVAPAASARVARQLGVDVRTVPGAGHFLAAEGFTELPVARDAVLELLARD